MGELSNEQRPILLHQVGDLTKSLDSVVVVVRQNGITERLNSIVLEHEIARHNDANLALAPALVKEFIFFRWKTTSTDVFAIFVPMAKPLCHRGLQESILGCPTGERKGNALLQRTDIDIWAFDSETALFFRAFSALMGEVLCLGCGISFGSG
jgi:hypothetical protein